jgi:hypothetical protein
VTGVGAKEPDRQQAIRASMARELQRRMDRDGLSRRDLLNLVREHEADWGDPGRLSRWLNAREAMGHDFAVLFDRILPAGADGSAFTDYRAELVVVKEGRGGVSAGERIDRPPDLLTGCFMTGDELYLAAAEAIRQSRPERAEHRVIKLASLHGHGGPRLAETPDAATDTPRSQFGHAIEGRLRDLKEPWKLLQLFNVPNLERLTSIKERFLGHPGPHLHVRAFAAPNALPMLSPLIIGNHHAFIAAQDDRHYRVRSGIQLQGRGAAEWASDYFMELWDIAPFRLSTPTGPIAAAWSELENVVNGLASAP